MYKEFESLMGEPTKSLKFLSEVSYQASMRLSSRIFIDEQKLPLNKLPVGGDEGLEPVLSFIPLAKEGFTLGTRSENLASDEESGLLRYTSPVSFSEIVSQLGLSRLKYHIIQEEPRLSLYRHSLVTFLALSQVRIVNSEGIDGNGSLISGTSYWPSRPTNEDVWELLVEIEEATRRMILDKKHLIRKESALRAVHFFAAGGKIAKDFKLSFRLPG